MSFCQEKSPNKQTKLYRLCGCMHCYPDDLPFGPFSLCVQVCLGVVSFCGQSLSLETELTYKVRLASESQESVHLYLCTRIASMHQCALSSVVLLGGFSSCR